MDTKKATTILILGGYGNAGRLCAKYILQETTNDVKVVIAGRTLSKAQELVDELNSKYDGTRARARQVDATNQQSVDEAIRAEKVGLLLVASCTTSSAKTVLEAAIRAKVDYMDIQLSDSEKLEALTTLSDDIDKAGVCVVTDGGFHPGIPAALVRLVAAQFEGDLKSANEYGLMQMNWKDWNFSDATSQELVQELCEMQSLVYSDKEWKNPGWTEYKRFDFGAPIGERYCVPMYMQELKPLPSEVSSLEEVGFYIAGLDWLTDYVVMPFCYATLALAGGRKAPSWVSRPLGRLMSWSMRAMSKAPYKCSVVVDAVGSNKKDENVHLRTDVSHEDGYELTAISAVACLLQMLDPRLRKAGLYCQGQFVEPVQFFGDMERLGVKVETKE